jgi:hypothetical protein
MLEKLYSQKRIQKKRKFLSIYYLCKLTGGEEKVGGDLVELKWINPTDVKKYFTTFLHPKLFKYLKLL